MSIKDIRDGILCQTPETIDFVLLRLNRSGFLEVKKDFLEKVIKDFETRVMMIELGEPVTSLDQFIFWVLADMAGQA